MNNKKLVLNNKGMLLLTIITLIVLISIMLESDDIILYLISKIPALTLVPFVLKLTNYLPKKYK